MVSPEIAAYADRAGKRLNRKHWRLLHAKRPPQVAATAVARELAGFIWGAWNRQRERCGGGCYIEVRRILATNLRGNHTVNPRL